MKKIFFIAILLYCYIVIFFLHPKPAVAQGTFSCQFWGDPANFIPNSCTLASSNCETAGTTVYKPDDCTLWVASEEQCQGIHQCVTETPADLGCSLADILGQCFDPKFVLCPGAVYCCPEAAACDKIKEKQKNILPTPTPTPPMAGACEPLVSTGTCRYRFVKCTDMSGETCCCAIKDACKAHSCAALFATPTPAPGIDIYGSCDKDKGEIDTAIGCIPTKDASAFIKWLLGRAILLAGGIAFLLMIVGALMVIVSSGNPEQVKAGSQLITSAISGLVFIIFSLFLLRLIGVEFLSIPGL